MFGKRHVGTTTVLLAALSSLAAAYDSQFHLQVGAFKSATEASETVAKASAAGVGAVQVREVKTGTVTWHKVIVGSWPHRDDAVKAQNQLKSQGLNSFVRVAEELAPEAIAQELASSSPRVFADPPRKNTATAAQAVEAGLSSDQKALLKELKQDSTTAPAYLANFRDFLNTVPDSNPLKGKETIGLVRRALSGTNPYENKSADFASVKGLLMNVANGKIAATSRDRFEARQLAARLLHYHERNRVAALRAHRQILSQAQEENDVRAVGRARMEIAAVTFELTKENRLDLALAEEQVANLWMANQKLEKTTETSFPATARAIAHASTRIGLMLSEIKMQRKEWKSADELIDTFIEAYSQMEECQPEVAEAWCHKAHVSLELGKRDETFRAADRAIEIAEKLGRPVWGDPKLDVRWKGWAWKNAACYKFEEDDETRERIKAAMFEKFPGHPGLKTYFGTMTYTPAK